MTTAALSSRRALSDFQPINWRDRQAQSQDEAAGEIAKLTRIVGKDCRLVPLAEIIADSPGQSREKAFDAERDEDDRALAESIREIGLIQPVVLVQLKNKTAYSIQAGHRRVAAMRYLGYPQILALVVREDTPELAFVTLAENTRKELASTERWKAVEYLRGLGFSADAIAQKTGIARRTIFRLLEIGALSGEARATLGQNSVDLSVAAAVGKVPGSLQADVALAVVQHGLTRQQTEALVESVKARLVEAGGTVDVEQILVELGLRPVNGATAPADAATATPEGAPAGPPKPLNGRGGLASKARVLTDKLAREVLLGYFPGLSPADVSLLAAEAARRRLPDRVLRLAGICVASGRQKPGDAIQTALRLERAPMARHWLALLETAAEAKGQLEDSRAAVDTEVFLAYAAQQFGELLKLAAAQAKKKK
jgi:ParB/RepB/Spo0J family partition protein